ncbi:MAG: MqnA/MqnD/SBP family protein [Phycisphaerales bacterium]
MSGRPVLSLAHSADADDVFMWWPITGKVDPRDPARVLAPPSIETGRFVYRSLPADIQDLNRRAVEQADLDITAISIFNYTRCAERYALSACGWSFGDGFGPKVVVRAESSARSAAAAALMARCADLGQAPSMEAGSPAAPRARIAVPGLQTTAFLTASLMLGEGGFEPVPMPFDRIVSAVCAGSHEGRVVDAGLLIHESQLDHHLHGLLTIADVGAWWKGRTGLPLPLGGNALRRGLESEHGPGTLRHIAGVLERSIAHALEHRAESMDYARTFSPALSDADLDRYITMYVSPLTLRPGDRGALAASRLFEAGERMGLIGRPPAIDLVTG